MGEGVGGPSKLNEDDDDEDEATERAEGQKDVLWEVGSVSDTSDRDEKERRGIGGGKNSKGERRGLLVDEEEEAEERDKVGTSKRPIERVGDPFEDAEGFGDYEGVGAEDLPSPEDEKP